MNPLSSSFGSAIRLNVKSTSLAVSGLPLWKVMSGLSRIVHDVASSFEVISSARTFEIPSPLASSATRPL